MKKTIHIVYPEYTAAEFEQAIPLVNHDIYADNVAHPVRRLVLQITSKLFFILLLLLGFFILHRVLQSGLSPKDLTGKSFAVRLFVIILAAFIYLLFALFLTIDFQRYLYRLFHVRSRVETYSLRQYSEKRDNGKKLYAQYSFYKSCDRLRKAEILDISFSPSGTDTCTAKVSFHPENESLIEELSFSDIRYARKIQNIDNIDLWLDLEQRKLTIYTPEVFCR